MQSPKSQCILARPRRGGSFPPKPGGWVVGTCPTAGVPASSSTPAGPFSPAGGSSELPDLPGPLPKCDVPSLTFRLWWQLLPLMTWPPPACGVQGAGNREVEAPHSTLRSFSPAPPYPEIQGLLGDTWAGGGRGWDGEHPKQPLFLTAPSPAGKPDK